MLEERDDEQNSATEGYEHASDERLYTLMLNGDDEACAHYVARRVLEGNLKKQDVKYLDAAVNNLDPTAAVVGIRVHNVKNGQFKSARKEFLGYAVLEQIGDTDAHKRLKKAYRKSYELIDETDREVFVKTVNLLMAPIKDNYLSFTVEAVRADKSVADSKSALVVNLRFVDGKGREICHDGVYTAYLRGKDGAAARDRLADVVAEQMSVIAERLRIKTGEIYIDGKRVFRCDGSAPGGKMRAHSDGVQVLSGAELDIRVSGGGRLGRDVCSECGGAIGADGVCLSCGHRQAERERGIVIHKSKDMERLACTQCGAPVRIDEGGKTAYCTYCGTTFAVNGSSLIDGIRGLNYKSIRADMPEGATLPEIAFVRAGLAGGAITAIIPESFTVMPEEMRRIKYPTNAPRYIYTTPDSTVNLNFTFGGSLREDDVFAFGKQMIGSLKNTFPAAMFGEAKQISSPRNLVSVEFITQAIDQNIYNSMFFFSLGGKYGIGSWNCLGKDRWFWAQIFEHAVRTIEFNDDATE